MNTWVARRRRRSASGEHGFSSADYSIADSWHYPFFSSEFPVLKASVVDILENDIETLDFFTNNDGDQLIALPFRSYEIKTLKLKIGERLKKKQKRSGSVSSGGWVRIETD
jgi:hypothetical protein